MTSSWSARIVSSVWHSDHFAVGPETVMRSPMRTGTGLPWIDTSLPSSRRSTLQGRPTWSVPV